jgi:hypothetical protein
MSYLVAETLRGDDGDLIADSLVGLEVKSELWVVTLNDDLGGLLDSLSAYATHDCGLSRRLSRGVVVVEGDREFVELRDVILVGRLA